MRETTVTVILSLDQNQSHNQFLYTTMRCRAQTIDLLIEQLQNKQIKLGSSRVCSKKIHMFYAVYIHPAAEKNGFGSFKIRTHIHMCKHFFT